MTPAPANGFPGVPGCNSVWQVFVGDTCSSIAAGSGLESAASVVALNPGLDCTHLMPAQLICMGSPNDVSAACGFNLVILNGSDTCSTIRATYGSAGSPLPVGLFLAINPGMSQQPHHALRGGHMLRRGAGLSCGPTGTTALPVGTQVCLPPGQGFSSARHGRGLSAVSNQAEDRRPGVVAIEVLRQAANVSSTSSLASFWQEAPSCRLHCPLVRTCYIRYRRCWLADGFRSH